MDQFLIDPDLYNVSLPLHNDKSAEWQKNNHNIHFSHNLLDLEALHTINKGAGAAVIFYAIISELAKC